MHPAFSAIFFLPLVSAVSNLVISNNPTSGGPATISWSADTTDPSSCSFELVNAAFHDTFAIANNIPINTGSINVTLPIVPAPDQYTIEAVQISNVSDVLGTSAPFTIGATVTSTSSSASTSSASSSSVSATSPAGSSASSQASSSTGSRASSSSSSSSATSSSFNGNGALSHISSGNAGSIAAVVIGIAAGAVFV